MFPVYVLAFQIFLTRKWKMLSNTNLKELGIFCCKTKNTTGLKLIQLRSSGEAQKAEGNLFLFAFLDSVFNLSPAH